jgi:hypothetical protein
VRETFDLVDENKLLLEISFLSLQICQFGLDDVFQILDIDIRTHEIASLRYETYFRWVRLNKLLMDVTRTTKSVRDFLVGRQMARWFRCVWPFLPRRDPRSTDENRGKRNLVRNASQQSLVGQSW